MMTMPPLASIKDIDTNFDFTSDSKNFWNGFWDTKRNGGFGSGGSDPDSASMMLRHYHCVLWSRTLPNGEELKLCEGGSKFYLRRVGEPRVMDLGSDSITVSFKWNWDLMQKVQAQIVDYKSFMEDWMHTSYTIGGMMLFPAFWWGLNQSRGCHLHIKDRWDLTLECIRRYYLGEPNALSKCFERGWNKEFFSWFVDFKGFVDYFLLQDCVTEDYSAVKLWHSTSLDDKDPVPNDAKSYLAFMDKQIEFLANRNRRIKELCNNYK